MQMPELIRRTAEKELSHYCDIKIPPCFRNEVRVDFQIEDDCATLFEERIVHANPGKWARRHVAQFRFNRQLNQWSLHYPDSRHSWRLYLNAGPSLNFKALLKAVDDDPLNSFWD